MATFTTMEDIEGVDEEFLLEASRTPEGRSVLSGRELVSFLLRSISSSSPLPLRLLLRLRLLRNLCAGQIVEQDSFVRSDGVDVIASILLGSTGKEVASPAEVVRVGIQVLANVSAAGEEHQSAVWRRFFPLGLLELAGVGDSRVCDPLCMVLHFCCCSRNGRGNRVRMEELLGIEKGLPIVSQIIRTASSVGYRGDWLQFLISRICFEEMCFSKLFSELKISDDKHSLADDRITNQQFTTEQAFFMGILSEILSEHPYEGQIRETFPSDVFQVFEYALSNVDFTSHRVSSLPTGIPAVDVLGFSLNILKDFCALEEHMTAAISSSIDILLSMGFCRLLLSLLRNLEPPPIIRKSHAHGEHEEPSTIVGLFCPYKGFRRDIVAAIGNVTYGRKKVQDEVREEDGILLLLQQCATDEDNPFLREWGIWTVRNLLEGNEDNQRLVAELELQGPVNTPEISEMGLKVDIDRKNRRAKLVNIS